MNTPKLVRGGVVDLGEPTVGSVADLSSHRRSNLFTVVTPAPIDRLRPTVFHEEWWLDAATGGNYQEATVQRDGKIIGRFPYIIARSRAGFKLCTMPPLTHFLGPTADPGQGATSGRQVRLSRIVGDLIRKLPITSAFYHKMHAGVIDLVPFQEQGYDVSVQYTYEIAPSPEMDAWKRMRDKTRNAIRGSKARVFLDNAVSPAEFVEFIGRNLRNKNLVNTNPDDKVMAICQQALLRGQGRLSGTRAPSGKLTSAVFCPCDAVRSYYLLSSRCSDAGLGDVSLLVWDAIRHASSQGLIFDFDGIGTAGSVNFFEGFGGTIQPRYIATRYSLARKAIMLIRSGRTFKVPKFC